jgi:hypothetical protein
MNRLEAPDRALDASAPSLAPLRIGTRVAEQRLIAIICNQLAKETDLAQPFSEFDVPLNGVRTL